ncbi:MAG: trypsin-like peptidase domain-containing protein [bacterium]
MPGPLRSSRPPCPALAQLWWLCALSLVGPMSCRSRREADSKSNASQIPPQPAPVKILYPAAPGSFVRLIKRLRPSLVHLHATSAIAGGPATTLPVRQGADDPYYATSPLRDRVERSLGTGVILDRQGHVLTALRVLRHATEIRARLHDGTDVSAKVVGQDPDTGIGVLLLQQPAGGRLLRLTPAPYGSSSQLRPGDWVVAAGDPFGTQPYVSAGLVSSPGAPKGLTLSRPGYFSFIMTDARINAANAGGPLVNQSGEVVGINVTFDDRQRQLGFAVPINMIRDVLPTLLKHGRVSRSWVGIYVKEVTPQHATTLGLVPARGALVSEVVAGGPAAQAGLQVGDVVLSFDGKAVTKHQELTFAAARTPSGRTVLVKVWRGKREHVLSLRLERKPE